MLAKKDVDRQREKDKATKEEGTRDAPIALGSDDGEAAETGEKRKTVSASTSATGTDGVNKKKRKVVEIVRVVFASFRVRTA